MSDAPWQGREINEPRARARSRHATILAILGFLAFAVGWIPMAMAQFAIRERFPSEATGFDDPLTWICTGAWVVLWGLPFGLAERIHHRRHLDTSRDPRSF
ncbi:MAG: hypothetical protein MUE69_00290 [Myxococcota bacterium]|jgi:hypothetical protein|nr:hypothetical protein [Myxococcota bacterium]